MDCAPESRWAERLCARKLTARWNDPQQGARMAAVLWVHPVIRCNESSAATLRSAVDPAPESRSAVDPAPESRSAVDPAPESRRAERLCARKSLRCSPLHAKSWLIVRKLSRARRSRAYSCPQRPVPVDPGRRNAITPRPGKHWPSRSKVVSVTEVDSDTGVTGTDRHHGIGD